MAPERIQRKRTKGWRMPTGAVYVGRPTKWGNPHFVEDIAPDLRRAYPILCAAEAMDMAREIVCEMYREDILDGSIKADLSELRGKDLACWCPLYSRCHADVLIELANKPVMEGDR